MTKVPLKIAMNTLELHKAKHQLQETLYTLLGPDIVTWLSETLLNLSWQ